jgi:stearoyl-CoA desaturase (delta-9 desaturase)
MASYAREVRRACASEIEAARARSADLSVLEVARRWLHRDTEKVPAELRQQLAQVRAEHPVLEKMLTMREELRQLWSSTTQSREQLAGELQAWCKRAEDSGIAALREFSFTLRAVRV